MKQERIFQLDLNETFSHLAAAPIVEAVIHWRARAGKVFQSEVLRQQLVERLPGYPDCRPQHQLEVESQFAGGSASQIQRQIWQGFRLTSEDKRHIVQFTRDGVAFSRLTPYEEWNVFAAEGQRLWRIFVELAEPTEVQRLGVRFINRIRLEDLTEVRKYLARPPKCLEPLGLPVGQFFYQSLHDVPGHPFQVNVVQTVQAPAPPQTQELGLILDIDVGTTQALLCDDRVLQEFLTQMHWLKNKAFFNLLSKKAVTLFQGRTP
ncbi:MAG: TIGR04255 family protein [Sedimentisphaerales bacterium]|nr:TIGR04255 family protein [Sedimentisphaerales bacterium]